MIKSIVSVLFSSCASVLIIFYVALFPTQCLFVSPNETLHVVPSVCTITAILLVVGRTSLIDGLVSTQSTRLLFRFVYTVAY